MQKITMYSTNYCPYCIQAKQLLKARGVATIYEIRVDLNSQERENMVSITGRRTVPQIFIGSVYVGGYAELLALDKNKKLFELLQAKDV